MILFSYYFIFINLTGFLLMFIDKRRAIQRKWRISEKTLFAVCFLGGSLGSLLGMTYFRHKTKHFKFKYGIPIILFFQCMLLIFLKVKGII